MADPDLGGVVRVERGGDVKLLLAQDNLDVVLSYLGRRELTGEGALAGVGPDVGRELTVVRTWGIFRERIVVKAKMKTR